MNPLGIRVRTDSGTVPCRSSVVNTQGPDLLSDTNKEVYSKKSLLRVEQFEEDEARDTTESILYQYNCMESQKISNSLVSLLPISYFLYRRFQNADVVLHKISMLKYRKKDK